MAAEVRVAGSGSADRPPVVCRMFLISFLGVARALPAPGKPARNSLPGVNHDRLH